MAEEICIKRVWFYLPKIFPQSQYTDINMRHRFYVLIFFISVMYLLRIWDVFVTYLVCICYIFGMCLGCICYVFVTYSVCISYDWY